MAATQVWSGNLKEEPASPLRLSEQEEWYNASDNVAVEVVVDEAKQSRGEAASKLLQDLDQWLKDEDPFPQWMENTMEFQIFEDLPLPLVPVSSQDTVTSLKPSTPPALPTPAPTFTPAPLKAPLTPPAPTFTPAPLKAPLTPPSVKVSAPPTFSRVEVIAVKPLQTPNFTNLNPVQYKTESSPDVLQFSPTGLDDFNYAFTPLDTLTPPESPERIDAEEALQTQEIMVIQQMVEMEEIDKLVNMRAEHWVESPDTSFSSNSSVHEESESVASPSSASSCSDPEWTVDTSYEVKTPKRRRTGNIKPYTKPAPEEKKLRKKEQNKNAATRYRLKKKQEQDELFDEEKHLQHRNEELKSELTEVQREIKYLKNLMRDVCKAKGLIK